MKKFILIYCILSISIFAQEDNSLFKNEPYSIIKNSDKIIIAGGVNTFIYNNYYGSNVRTDNYSDPHIKPEYLVYEFFKAIKSDDISKLKDLFDSSYKESSNQNDEMKKLKNFDDIKFHSKFKISDLLVIRYNFVSSKDDYPYFAVVRKINNKYHLTASFNISDPFHIIGSLSPYNYFDKSGEIIDINNFVPFYFVENEDKIYYSNEMPSEDWAGLYINFNFYSSNDTNNQEIDFINKIHEVSLLNDSAKIIELVYPEHRTLLEDKYFKSYLLDEVMKIFRYSTKIIPLAGVNSGDGLVIYLKIFNNENSSNIYSLIFKQESGNYYISLKYSDDTLYDILENVYIKQAIYDYFQNK